jgi:hypothetical protein
MSEVALASLPLQPQRVATVVVGDIAFRPMCKVSVICVRL